MKALCAGDFYFILINDMSCPILLVQSLIFAKYDLGLRIF